MEKLEDSITEAYHDECDEIYRKLEKEYDYLVSDESVKETLLANDWEFDEFGKIW